MGAPDNINDNDNDKHNDKDLEGKTGVPGEKPLGAKEKTNNKLNPHMASTSGFEPGPHWWEASALTTMRHPLLPGIIIS